MTVSLVGKKPYIIPSRPDILIRLNTLLGASEPDIDRIVAEIRDNVALYSAVIAIANSPAFSGSKQITALEQAIMRVGLVRLRMIIQLVELKNALSKAGPMERFWDSATEVADLTARLTAVLGNASVDDAYTLGMIHDCGIPLMMEALPDYKAFLKQINGLNLHQFQSLEEEHYGYNHFDIGAEIADKWHMSAPITHAIRLQPHYLDAVEGRIEGDDKAITLLSNLLLAKEISKTYRKFWRINDTHPLCFELKPVLTYLGISDIDYTDIRDNVMDDLEAR